MERPQNEAKVTQKDEKCAFFTTWGDSGFESDESEPDFLMANEDLSSDDEDVKVTDLNPELIAHDDLVALTKCLIEENSTYSEHLEELENESQELKSELLFLTKSLD